MNDPQIICPKCRTSIKLTETLAAPLVARAQKQFELKQKQRQTELTRGETVLRRSQLALRKAQTDIDAEIQARIQAERGSIVEVEAKKAKLALAADIKRRDRQLLELQSDLRAKNGKLAQAQKAHAEVLRKSRELDDARRELELSVQLKVQESLNEVRSQAKSEVEDRLAGKISEREIQIAGMQRQIEKLRRQAEQGSQQIQGEALELELESLLCNRFPHDLIEPIVKGVFGGDVIQRVRSHSGQPSGTILWECKRTKAWSDGWLGKVRENQRAAKADIALIISDILPTGIESFDFVDHVWVARPRFAVPLAVALRQSMIHAAISRRSNEGRRTKVELVYKYLTGPQFRQRIEAIVEKFTDMRADLDRERKAITRIWARREEQLRLVLDSSAGLYGDLQGIAGRGLAEINSLDFHLIEDERRTHADGTGTPSGSDLEKGH